MTILVMNRSGFPLTIRVGQTRAMIYETPSRGCSAYTVCWYEGPTRKRKAFADLDAAKLHATTQVNSLSRGEADAIRLSGADRLEYLRAREAVSEFGISLDSAAAEYRDVRRLLGELSILEAARHYANHKRPNLPTKLVPEVVREMVAAKRDAGLSLRYLQDLESRLGEFARDFQCPVASVRGAQIKAWLQAKSVGNRTRNNSRLAIQTLFAFAKTAKYLPPESNEMEAVPAWKTVAEEVEIFTPDEMGVLLAAADAKLRPFLVIGAFAGLRSAEIQRLDWADIDLGGGYIRVSAHKSKTGSRRLVPIAGNLREWLTPLAKPRGPVSELANLPNAIQRLIQSLEAPEPPQRSARSEPTLQWKHNALRHSFSSYRLALVKNAAQVALEAGNCPRMIFEHYRELVREQDANRWFALSPTPSR